MKWRLLVALGVQILLKQLSKTIYTSLECWMWRNELCGKPQTRHLILKPQGKRRELLLKCHKNPNNTSSSSYYILYLEIFCILLQSNFTCAHRDVLKRHKLTYTVWPRKNATTSAINFKDIVNETDLCFILLGRKLIFQQIDTILGEAFGNCYFSEPMSFSKFATFSTLAILRTARIVRFTASRTINCCIMNSSVCSHCLRFQSKGSVSATGRPEVRILLYVPKYDGVEKVKIFENDIASLK